MLEFPPVRPSVKGEKERFGEQLASTGPLLKVGVLSQEVPCRAALHETAVTQPCSRCPSRERPAAGAPGAPPRGQCVYSPALPLELMPKYSFCQCPFRRRGFHPAVGKEPCPAVIINNDIFPLTVPKQLSGRARFPTSRGPEPAALHVEGCRTRQPPPNYADLTYYFELKVLEKQQVQVGPSDLLLLPESRS